MDTHAIAQWTRHPVRAVEDEARHLHHIEVEGSSGVTPLISLAEVAMLLLPILVIVMGTAMALYYLV